jgi:hypothetical protein
MGIGPGFEFGGQHMAIGKQDGIRCRIDPRDRLEVSE